MDAAIVMFQLLSLLDGAPMIRKPLYRWGLRPVQHKMKTFSGAARPYLLDK